MRFLTVLGTLALLCQSALGDWIELVDGSRVAGTVLVADDKEVFIRTSNGIVTFDRDQIRSIHQGPVEKKKRTADPIIEVVDTDEPSRSNEIDLGMQSLTTPTEFKRIDGVSLVSSEAHPVMALRPPEEFEPSLFGDNQIGFRLLGRFSTEIGDIEVRCDHAPALPRSASTLTALKDRLGLHYRHLRQERSDLQLLGFDLANLSFGTTIRVDVQWGPADAPLRELAWWVRTHDGALHRLSVRAASATLETSATRLEPLLESWLPRPR